MLANRSPHEAYRRVDFDARVEGANPQQLVGMCYEALAGALGTALYAHERGDNRLKSQSLTRALSAVTALQLGVIEYETGRVVIHPLRGGAALLLLVRRDLNVGTLLFELAGEADALSALL